jgi:SAM-dependent methyltransferase
LVWTAASPVAQVAGAATTPTRGKISATAPADFDAAAEYERAAIKLDGEVLFQVRGIPAYPAEERAKAIKQRIEAIAADQSVAVESLRVVDMEDRTRIMAGDILVAGCGTGQNLVETARDFKGALVLAVDLSLASLCYAKRQALALGLTNIAFGEADILKLGGIGRTFDIVDASGVLHHMADPWAGWQVLLSLLRPGGFMRLGLYSRLGRQDVNAARAFIARRGYAATAQDIRRSRQDILQLPEGEPARSVARHLDFFTVSECRDMLFHVQEHQLTLSEIANFVGENEIEVALGGRVVTYTVEKRDRFPVRIRYARASTPEVGAVLRFGDNLPDLEPAARARAHAGRPCVVRERVPCEAASS